MFVLIADGRAKVRSALRLLLEQQPGIQVLGEAIDTTGVFDWIRAACPDVILLDWELPGQESIDLVAELGRKCPATAIVILSSRPEVAQEAVEAGAHVFVSKSDPPERLLMALGQLCDQGV
ncbi:MAG: response regulator transcription factor [Anaerolineae bacterium]|jgi:DNA-binding NarL/FixJ family response regulator